MQNICYKNANDMQKLLLLSYKVLKHMQIICKKYAKNTQTIRKLYAKFLNTNAAHICRVSTGWPEHRMWDVG